MTVRAQTFDPHKAVEAVLLVASRVANAGFHQISKLLYFADRIHLERYGRLICGDSYVAMQHGPVPSATYDLLKATAGRGDSRWADLAAEAFDVVEGYVVRPKRAPDERSLARSEIACLEEVIREHGTKSFGELADLSHDRAWHSADANDFISLDALVETLPNAEQVRDHLRRG